MPGRWPLRKHYLAIAIFAAAYLLLGLLVRNSYYQLIMTLVLDRKSVV